MHYYNGNSLMMTMNDVVHGLPKEMYLASGQVTHHMSMSNPHDAMLHTVCDMLGGLHCLDC
jgi:uncharacterized YccA/Bax inhibitor family protein